MYLFVLDSYFLSGAFFIPLKIYPAGGKTMLLTKRW